jgi:hypothetical protein
MTHLYKLGQDDSTPYGRHWPWWFQTMLRDGGMAGRGLHAPWHVLHYSQQEPKIQQCVFEKGGTKKFRALHCLAINSTFTYTQVMWCYKEQTRPPGSQKVVFLRDPLDRFLSGFLDKCISYTREGHCEPTSVFHDNETGLVNDFLKDQRKLFEIYVDTFPLQWNLHFFPQSLFCNGLYRDIADYSFIGNLGNDFYQDLRRLTEQYPALEHLVEKLFHMDENENVTLNQGVETKAASRTLKFYTPPRTVRRVLEYTAIDYVMLGLPIPSWAERMLAIDANMMGIE